MASSTGCRLKSAQPSSVPQRATSNLQPATVEMISAVIVAAGRGARMGPGVDKLFLEVAGRPVVAHTLQRFGEVSCIDELIVVAREELLSEFGDLVKALQLRKPYRVVVGGSRRQDSVWNGLHALSPQSEIVAIQDGARPCTPAEVIAATIAA